MRYSKIESLISGLANQQISLIQDSLSSSEQELRIEEVKSGEWKYVFGRMELDEAWIAGFNTA